MSLNYSLKSVLFFLGLVIVLFLGMQWGANPSDFQYTKVAKEDLDKVLKSHSTQLKLPIEPKGNNLNVSWSFFKEEKQFGLFVKNVPDKNGFPVQLPHRILEPNTALWYTTKMKITETKIWKINADDGCQLFLNGKQVLQYHEGGYFLMEASKDNLVDIRIRVLNNAMHGGLRQVKLVSKDSLDQFFKESGIYLDYLYALEYYQENTDKIEIDNSRFDFNKDSLNLNGLINMFMGYPVLAPAIVSFPTRQKASIRIKTFQESKVELEWGSDGLHFEQKITAHPEKGYVQFDLHVFEMNSTVFYRIRQEKSVSGIYSFKTPASHKDNFTFTAWGDSQGGWETFGSLVNQKEFLKGDFFIGLGDLVNEGCDPLPWFHFTISLKPALKKGGVMLVPGNHDYDGYYDNLIPENYHSLSPHNNYFLQSWGNAAFLALDLNEVFPLGFNATQDSLFKEAIESEIWKTAQWHFLLVHQPVHSQGWPGYEGEEFLKKYLSPLFESAEIDFVLSGHTHDYERLSEKYGAHSTHFVITGGGGGGIEPQDKQNDLPKMERLIKEHHFCSFEVNYNHCHLKVYNKNGEKIDEKTFIKPLKGIDR